MSRDDFDFWGGLVKNAYTNIEGASDSVNMFLDESIEKDATDRSLIDLTDKGRSHNALSLPVPAGTRVRFIANLGTLLSYDDVPDNGQQGTVVHVRSAGGEITHHGGKVFVQWDDNRFRAIHTTHLRRASKKTTTRTSSGKVRVACLGDLTEFLKISGDTLVHKATKDIWSFSKDKEGYLIERLLGEDGKPLKI